MLLVDSIYINSGGGLTLLKYLIDGLDRSNIPVFYLFDERCRTIFQDKYPDASFLVASISRRTTFYKENRYRFSRILCFGNVPPPIKCTVPVYTYFQNVLLLTGGKGSMFSKGLFLLKKLYIRLLKSNTDYFVVQSGFVGLLMQKKLGISSSHCLVIPFYEEPPKLREVDKRSFMYLYVSSGENHKNHRRLLAAWRIISLQYPDLELHLTIDQHYQDLIETIQRLNNEGVKVINHGILVKHELNKLYSQSRWVIYPSIEESFGLGIVEGVSMGCDLIAADLPYVNEISKPTLVFDPFSVEDIAEKVIESQKNPSLPLTSIVVKDELGDLISLLS